jgi:hypothetical protein
MLIGFGLFVALASAVLAAQFVAYNSSHKA